MGRGVTVCDWTKQVVDDEETCLNLVIGEETFVLSPEGYDAMLEFFRGKLAMSAPASEDTSRILTKDDLRPPRRTREEGEQIVADSKVAELGQLGSLQQDRANAQKLLDKMNADIELDMENDKAGIDRS